MGQNKREKGIQDKGNALLAITLFAEPQPEGKVDILGQARVAILKP